nr:putative ribonuclease H protein At1g65750 family [Tanacetum cinerariifolium]
MGFEFETTISIPRGYNYFFFTLVPKVDDPIVIGDFRPTSLIGCQYKIIAKVLANRLANVISLVVGEVQMTFIKCREIIDGPITVDEIISWAKLRKKFMLKLEFEKAFAIEVLNVAFIEAKNKNFFHGVEVGVNKVHVSHLQFADDALILGDCSKPNMENLSKIPTCFHLASDLKVNFNKSPQGGLHDASLIQSKSGPRYRIAKLKEDLLNNYWIYLPLIFKKKIGLRKVVRPCMGLTLAQCRKVKKVGDRITREPATEAPVNGGRNYNGPKENMAVLWNPTISKTVSIDWHDVLDFPGETFFDFGVCSDTCDLKLVKMIFDCKLKESYTVEIFTLSSGVWRSPHSNLPRKSICFTHCQHSKMIMSFAMTSEEFLEMPFPDSLATKGGIGLGITKLRDSLIVVEITHNDQVYGIWMMKNHGDPKSFTKMFNINLADASMTPDEESVSLKDEGTTKIRAFMAIVEDEPSIGKADARSGQWVDITLKNIHRLLAMTDRDERKHVLD